MRNIPATLHGWRGFGVEPLADAIMALTPPYFVLVKTVDDLPAASGGYHQLADNTMYLIGNQPIMLGTNGLQYGENSFVAGDHWGRSVLVYTGTGAALKSDGHEFFARFLTVSAPAGKGFDLAADISTEFLMTLCAFVNCAEIGSVTGYRVPTIVKCAFENYGAGLTFGGTVEKVLVDGSPFRGGADGSAALDFAATFATTDIDLVGNYFKSLGVGSFAIRWNAAATLTGFGVVRGNLMSNGATFATGIGPESLRWDFTGNSGVRDSDRAADYSMSGNATATVLTQNVWAKIAGTTVDHFTERLEMTATNRIENVSPRMIRAKVSYTTSVLGSVNGQEVETAMFTSTGAAGAMEIASAAIKSVLTGPAGARADNLAGNAIVDIDPGEYVEIWMRCTSGSNNITAESLQVTAIG